MASDDSKSVIRILEPSAGGTGWQLSERVFSVEALASLPQKCYVFLDVADYKPTDGRRERILSHFNVPEYVANRTCFELNGYFGSKAGYDEQSITNLTTWFRCLVKMVRKVQQEPHDNAPEYATSKKKDYKWFEMTFFTRWDNNGTSQVLCVDTPFDFAVELKKLLEKQSEPLNFWDPFAMHVSLVDQIIVYADISVWRVRDPVRLLEKTRLRLGAIFGPIHEMNRHAIHTTEVLEASIDTISALQERRAAIHEKLTGDLGETYRDQAKDYAQFQISMLKSLKLRSLSNQERLKDEIGLAFNNLARQDNDVMKSIALLTMVFLPATFISAIFSTTFFNFGDDGSWLVSEHLWIYWATIVPATIVSVVVWQIWVSHSDAIVRFVQGLLGAFIARREKQEKQKAARQLVAGKMEDA